MATYGFVHGAALTPSDLARREETKRLALSLGHTPSTWKAAGHVYHVYPDAYEASPDRSVLPPPPPRVVEASAQRTRPETTPVTPAGTLLPDTHADTLLRMWLSPIGARPASTALLLVGQSLWSPVLNGLRGHSPARLYPTTYGDRGLSVTELPIDLTTLSVFRSLTCHANIIVITMPNIAAVAAFAAQRWPLLRDAMPQHSFVFTSPDSGAAELPSRITDVFTVIRWQDADPQRLPDKKRSLAPPSEPLLMVAASHLRSGGVLHPGLTAAQQLGLELMSQRDVAYYAMQEQAAVQAARISAIAGHLPSAKRMRPADFLNPARVGDAALQGSAGDFGRNTFA